MDIHTRSHFLGTAGPSLGPHHQNQVSRTLSLWRPHLDQCHFQFWCPHPTVPPRLSLRATVGWVEWVLWECKVISGSPSSGLARLHESVLGPLGPPGLLWLRQAGRNEMSMDTPMQSSLQEALNAAEQSTCFQRWESIQGQVTLWDSHSSDTKSYGVLFSLHYV